MPIKATKQQKEVATLRAKGMTFKEIGESLNITGSAARQRFKSFEIKQRYLSAAKEFLEGATAEEIHEKYGYTEQTIESIAEQYKQYKKTEAF